MLSVEGVRLTKKKKKKKKKDVRYEKRAR